MINILFLGDIMGRNGRDEVISQVPLLKERYSLDFVIANAENAAHGFGLTPQICDDLYKAGVNCITTGNHVWDKRELIPRLDQDSRLLRALNYPPGTPGRGLNIFETRTGRKVLVIHLMGRLFMDALDDPFAAVDKVLSSVKIGKDVHAIVIDIHGEASSEKQAMGLFCDGRASLVIGTHTHVPTADTRIMPKGTGFQTDAGMCGHYNSVIGMEAAAAISKFVRKIPGEKLQPADGPVTLCGVIARIDDKSGLCQSLSPFRKGGILSSSLPES